MAASSTVSHVQAKFFTKQERFAVPDTPFSVPADVDIEQLSSLINSLLVKGDSSEHQNVSFDFLVDGEFLRISLQEHMLSKDISTETVVEIEYVERQPPPEPQDSLVHDDWVSCVRGAGSILLSGCYDDTLKLWTDKGENLLTIPGHSAPVKAVAWIDSDGQDLCSFVSTSHDQTALIWQWNKLTNAVDCVHSCRGHAGSVDCVAVDKTKTKLCTGSWDKMLKLWSAVPKAGEEDEPEEQSQKKRKKKESKMLTRVPILTLSGHKEGVSSCVFIDNDEICTASWDHTIRLWDLTTAQEKGTLTGSKVFNDIAYSDLNHQLVSASTDRHVRLWDPRITDGAVCKATFTSHTGWVSSVSWSPSNQYHFISGSYDNMLKLWDTRSPTAPLYNMGGHEDKILAVDWSIPDLMLSGGSDNHLKMFRYTPNLST